MAVFQILFARRCYHFDQEGEKLSRFYQFALPALFMQINYLEWSHSLVLFSSHLFSSLLFFSLRLATVNPLNGFVVALSHLPASASAFRQGNLINGRFSIQRIAGISSVRVVQHSSS